MTVQDVPSVPALPDRARPFRWGYFTARLLTVAALLALAAVLPTGRAGGPLRYREGDIARERTVAPYDFRVEKDEPTLRREQQQAAAAVAPVFVKDTRVSAEMLDRLAMFEQRAIAAVSDPAVTPADRALRLRDLGVPLTPEGAEALSAPGRARRALKELGAWLHEV